MYCLNCGNEISEGSTFCTACGTPVQSNLDRSKKIIKKSRSKNPAPDTSGDIIFADQQPMDMPVRAKHKGGSGPLKGIVIALCAALVLGGIGFGVYKGIQYVKAQKQEKFEDAIKDADRYLEDLDYEQAIASYQAAIEIEPKDPRPYIGMADAYIGMGDYEAARDILKEGYEQTEDRDIRKYLKDVEEALNSRTKFSGTVISVNEEGFGSGGVVEGASVHLEKKSGTSYDEKVLTDENGAYEFEDLIPGKYDMTIKSDGFLQVEQEVDIYPGQEEMYAPVLMLIPEEYSGEGYASGRIIDAVTGYGVSDLSLKVRQGYNDHNGKVVDDLKTDEDGYYMTSKLPAGYYTIETIDRREVDERYMKNYFTVRIMGERDTENQNASVSTKLMDGQIRIVLSWGAYPYDLDSHLFCSLEDGTHHMNFWNDPSYYDSSTSERIVDLDLDDTDQYGPETTTIYTDRPGLYTFGVYNFSEYNDWYGSDDGELVESYERVHLEDSQAMVQVYMGDTFAPTYVFYVPRGEGLFWEVFQYDSRTERLTAINRIVDDYAGHDYYE